MPIKYSWATNIQAVSSLGAHGHFCCIRCLSIFIYISHCVNYCLRVGMPPYGCANKYRNKIKKQLKKNLISKDIRELFCFPIE